MSKEQIIQALRQERDWITALEPDMETLRRISKARARRNGLILAAIKAGATEREAVEAAGVTRGLLWKIKKGLREVKD